MCVRWRAFADLSLSRGPQTAGRRPRAKRARTPHHRCTMQLHSAHVHDGLEHLDLRSAVGSLTIQYGCLSLLSRVLKACCGDCGDRRVEGRSAEKKVRAAKQILPLERTSEGPEFASLTGNGQRDASGCRSARRHSCACKSRTARRASSAQTAILARPILPGAPEPAPSFVQQCELRRRSGSSRSWCVYLPPPTQSEHLD